jgi:hypothetical protein
MTSCWSQHCGRNDKLAICGDNFPFKWILWLGPIGCRRPLVTAISSKKTCCCLRAPCGRRPVPPKPPFPGCLGGTRLWAHRWRTAEDIPASPASHCGLGPPGVLKYDRVPQSNPRQPALPLPFLLIFESSPTHLTHLLSSLSPQTHNFCLHKFEAEKPPCNDVDPIHP